MVLLDLPIEEYFLRGCNNLRYLILQDYNDFHVMFPHGYWLLFFVLRILPVLALCYPVINWLNNYLQRSSHYNHLKEHLPSTNIIFWGVFLLGLTLRLWVFFETPLITPYADALSRLKEAQEWYKVPTIIPGGLVWLPLHHLLLGLPSLFGANFIAGGRLVTLTLGIITIPLLYIVTRKRFGDFIALLSCFILAVNPFHVKFSVITMSEVPFIFFATASLLFLFQFTQTLKQRHLILCAVCLNCCNLIRFEGWIISVFLPFFLLYYNMGIKNFIKLSFLNSLSIVGYIVVSYTVTGHLIHGLTASDIVVKYAFENRPHPLEYIFERLSTGSIIPVWMFLFLSIGSIICLHAKKEIPWLTLVSGLLGLITWKVLRLTNEPMWRYFSTGIILSIPFSAVGLQWLSDKNQLAFLLVMLYLGAFSIVCIRNENISDKKFGTAPKGFFEAANWLKKNRAQGEHYLYNSAIDYPVFELLTETINNEMYHPPYDDTKKLGNYQAFSDTLFLQLVRRPEFKYIVYQKSLVIDSVFHLPWVEENLKSSGPLIEPAFSDSSFFIYKINRR